MRVPLNYHKSYRIDKKFGSSRINTRAGFISIFTVVFDRLDKSMVNDTKKNGF